MNRPQIGDKLKVGTQTYIIDSSTGRGFMVIAEEKERRPETFKAKPFLIPFSWFADAERVGGMWLQKDLE